MDDKRFLGKLLLVVGLDFSTCGDEDLSGGSLGQHVSLPTNEWGVA